MNGGWETRCHAVHVTRVLLLPPAGSRGVQDLVDYLLAQHSAGRVVTDTILKFAPTSRKEGEDRRQLISTMQAFITIYRPHAAWEDTDLFPKLKDVVSPHEYDAMAEGGFVFRD